MKLREGKELFKNKGKYDNDLFKRKICLSTVPGPSRAASSHLSGSLDLRWVKSKCVRLEIELVATVVVVIERKESPSLPRPDKTRSWH